MNATQHTANVDDLLDGYQLPACLGFGRELAPIMYRADFRDGRWHSGQILPFGEIAINPGATAVQFAQQTFEGMKSYRVSQASPALFRPELNFRRFTRSAKRLRMAPITAELFAEALTQVVSALQQFIPGQSGQSLYLRPTLLGMDHNFAVTGSDTFSFFLIASPSDAYYAKPIKVMIERKHCRAAAGGTGADKVGANYAGSLQAAEQCTDAGFDQPLWLDPIARQNIEELSGMNFMAVIDGALHTPKLSGSILPGVTRDSLLQLAGHLGIEVVERSMPIDELIDDIASARCSELFSCGTGAIVCPISAIGEADGTLFEPAQVNQMAEQLKTALLDIQEGRIVDPFDWMVNTADQDDLLERFRSNPP